MDKIEFVLYLAKLVQWGLLIYAWINIIAIFLTWINADQSNNIVRMIYKYTRNYWYWIQSRVAYQFKILSPYLAILLIYFLEIFLPGSIRTIGSYVLKLITFHQMFFNLFLYFGLASLSILISILWMIFLITMIWIIFTLVNPPLNQPIVRTIHIMIQPFIQPLQKILPRTIIDLPSILLAFTAFCLYQLCYSFLAIISYQLII